MRRSVADSPDDAELARRIAAREGAPDAEAELYARLAPRARLYGLRHLRNEAAAADLTQQVLLMTIESLRAGRLREPERLASFVLGTCRMVVRDLGRSAERRQRLLEQFGEDLRPACAPGAAAIDTERLADCLRRLCERDRTVMVLTFYRECRTEEIAAELGLSPTHVRVIRHRALAHLRKCMTNEGAS